MAHFRIPLLVVFFIYSTQNAASQIDSSGVTVSKKSVNHRNIITRFFEKQAQVRYIYQAAINPNATAVAWTADGAHGSPEVYLSSLSNTDSALCISAVSSANERCNETEPQWSPDGREIAFLSDARSHGQVQVFIANAATGALTNAQPLTQFDGYVSHLKWSPDGKSECALC